VCVVASGQLGACTGEPSSPTPGSSVVAAGGAGSMIVLPPAPTECANAAPDVGASPLSRLTHAAYDNTIRALFPGIESAARGFLADAHVGPFPSNAGVPVSEAQLDKYVAAAESIAQRAAADPATLGACGAQSPVTEQCARELIVDLGSRAFRRPLVEGEIASYLAHYRVGAEGATASDGLRVVISGLLQSPHFLYHVEQVATEGLALLDGHELAARLSYFLDGGPPDSELRALAAAGQLSEQLPQQARRLLSSPAARGVFGRMLQQWLGVDRVEEVTKDSAVVPEYSLQLATAMKQEVAGFAAHVLFDADHSLRTLLTGSVSVEPSLSALYGGAVSATPGVTVVEHRSGILTLPAVLTTYSDADQTSPIKRGKFVRNRLLCQELPSPPPDAVVTLPKLDPSLSTRDRFAKHREDPTCAGCHSLMDPLGFGFEAYDTIGRYRTHDGAFSVDDSGELVGEPQSVAGPFKGVAELADKLLESPEAQACVARYWTNFALSRALEQRDSCWMERVNATFRASGGDLHELIMAIVAAPAFKHRRAQ